MLSRTMTWQQLMGWWEYYLYEPFGEERGDLRTATLAALYVNAHRTKTSDPTATPNDFMPKFADQLDEGRKEAEKRKPMSSSGWGAFKRQMRVLASGKD